MNKLRMLKRMLSLGYWAFRNPDCLTMLRFDLERDSKEVNSQNRATLAGSRAWWYLHYLTFKER